MDNPLTKDITRKYNIVEYDNINEIFTSLYGNKLSREKIEKLLCNTTREEIVLENKDVRKYGSRYYYSEEMNLVDKELENRAKNEYLSMDFWKYELIKYFDINEIGEELLNMFIENNANEAKKFIIDKFKKLDREEILDMYSGRFYNNKINQILMELNYQKITSDDVDEYNLRILEKNDEGEEEEM